MAIKPGIWSMGDINNMTLFNRMKPASQGHRCRFAAKKFETARNVFSWAYPNETYQICYDNNLDIITQWLFAPTSSDNTPAHYFLSPDNVPLVNTENGQTFPYYFNANYQERYFNLHSVWRNGIAALPSLQKNRHVALFSAEGSTGDEGGRFGGYKSAPLNPLYNISESEWVSWKKNTVWPTIYNGLAEDLGISFIVNAGNDGGNLDWVNDNLPGTWPKFGHPAHTYNLSNEKNYVQRGEDLIVLDNGALPIAEHEGTDRLAWYKTSTKQNIWAVICNAIHHRMHILSISPKTSNDIVGSDLSAYYWANDHMGIRDIADTNKAWCQLRKCIDVADTVKYSAGTYGALIDPSKLSLYNSKLTAINADGTTSEYEKASKRTELILDNLNPARITALQLEFPDAGFVALDSDQERDAYNSDYIVNGIPDNYGFGLTQFDSDGTSKGYWRVGPTNDFYGRFARGFDHANEMTDMFFSTELMTDANYQMKVSIQYFDKADCSWSFKYHNGTSEQTQSFTTAGTNKWVKKLITLTDMQGGGQLANNSDFILHYESDNDAIFGLLEMERVAQNTPGNQPPIILITTPDTTITLPANSLSVSATAVDGDGTIETLTWSRVGGTPGGTCTFSSPNTASTTFQNLSAGFHVLRLTGIDDDDAEGYDEITIVVNESTAIPSNPEIDLGGDRILTLDLPVIEIEPDIIAVNPEPPVLVLESGDPTGYAITVGEDGISRIFVFSKPGIYTFSWTITDDNGTATETITFTVYAAESSNGNTGRFAPYRSQDVQLSQTGYLKAWLNVTSDFQLLNEPIVSYPGMLGEKYTVSVSHIWNSGTEAIPVYIRKDQLEAPGETVGEIGTLRMLWTPKIFVIGDGAKILEMMDNWLNEDLVLFVQDECNPSKFVQFGCECLPCNVQKNSFSSGTLKSGQKGFALTLESFSKFFYDGSITEKS